MQDDDAKEDEKEDENKDPFVNFYLTNEKDMFYKDIRDQNIAALDSVF